MLGLVFDFIARSVLDLNKFLPALLVNAHNCCDYEDDAKWHEDSDQDDSCSIYKTASRKNLLLHMTGKYGFIF